MTDADLIRAIQAGDPTALTVLYQRCLPVIWRYAYRQFGGHVQAAEDVVSETFLAALNAINQLDPAGGTLCGWLLGIARHKVADRGRRREHSRESSAITELGMEPRARREAPATVLEAAERTDRIAKTLGGLAEDQRIALEWKYLDGCSVAEIAERFGRSEKAVENLLYRARQSFRMLYGQ
jgi:RNA polymerase sigma-70 factor (ECF subfamily)